jgi:RPA family protein
MHRKNLKHALVPACRVFFGEFLMSDFFVQEDGMPFLVTPTGAKCNRLFGVGEVRKVARRGKIFRVTINDSTASLNIYTTKGIERGTIINANEDEKRSFIAFLGKVRLRAGVGTGKRAIILAEEVRAAEERERNGWIINTAWRTIERIELLRSKKHDSMLLDTAILKEALEHYAIDDDKLDALASTAINAVKSMWQQYHETTRDMILEMVKKAGKSGMERGELVRELKNKGLEEGLVEDVIDNLIQEKRCYELDIGVLKC